jgi:hypothetical protein
LEDHLLQYSWLPLPLTSGFVPGAKKGDCAVVSSGGRGAILAYDSRNPQEDICAPFIICNFLFLYIPMCRMYFAAE